MRSGLKRPVVAVLLAVVAVGMVLTLTLVPYTLCVANPPVYELAALIMGVTLAAALLAMPLVRPLRP